MKILGFLSFFTKSITNIIYRKNCKDGEEVIKNFGSALWKQTHKLMDLINIVAFLWGRDEKKKIKFVEFLIIIFEP